MINLKREPTGKVSFTGPDWKGIIDPYYGGILTTLQRTDIPNAPNVIEPDPGGACQMVVDTGNDPTQAVLFPPYTIQPIGSALSPYANETIFDTGGPNRPPTYEVKGIFPYFWASFEALDDLIPPDPRLSDQNLHGWSTLYHNWLNLPPTTYVNTPGTPIFWGPRNGVTSGIILVGNEIRQQYLPQSPWYTQWCPVKSPSFYITVSLKDASPDSFAGILFSKDLSVLNASSNINTVYGAVGYQLNVNRNGGFELVGPSGSMWSWGGDASTKAAAQSDTGVRLEMRVDSYAGKSIYINGVFRFSFIDTLINSPYTTGFGLFATGSSGKIKFINRAVFDQNIKFSIQYQGSVVDNTLLTSWKMSCDKQELFYRLGLPGVFINPAVQGVAEVWGSTIGPDGFYPLNTLKACYAGKADGSNGVFCKMVYYDVAPTWTPGHAMIVPANLGFNPLLSSNNVTPAWVTNSSLLLKLSPKKRLDLI